MPGLSQSTRLATPGGHSDSAMNLTAPQAVTPGQHSQRSLLRPNSGLPEPRASVRGSHGVYRLRAVNRPVGAALLPVAVRLLPWVGVADRVVS
jgi:hypothetical protein